MRFKLIIYHICVRKWKVNSLSCSFYYLHSQLTSSQSSCIQVSINCKHLCYRDAENWICTWQRGAHTHRRERERWRERVRASNKAKLQCVCLSWCVCVCGVSGFPINRRAPTCMHSKRDINLRRRQTFYYSIGLMTNLNRSGFNGVTFASFMSPAIEKCTWIRK